MADATVEVAPFLVSNDALADAAELQRRMRRDGYLFLRDLVPVDALYDLRRQILAICRQYGWVAAGGDLMDGVAAGPARVEGRDEDFWPVYDAVQKLEAFHALAHTPAIVDVIGKLVGEPVLVHPRNIARISFPQNVEHTTPAHQDYVHIQGTEETYTAWIPLGDCPQALGGLIVLSGSHRYGVLPTHRASGAGGLGVATDHLGLPWVGNDFHAGDCLIFHSLTVHRALPNVTPDRLRLSVDYRYQGQSQPLTAGSLLPHFGRLSWDEIYQGWSSTRYQRYWEGLDLKIVEWSPQYHQVG